MSEQNNNGPLGAIEKTASLDEVKLMPGDALQLQSMLEGQQDRLTVRIIGVMKPKSVLVRTFSGLNVCAFKSKVLKAQHAPFPYLHLAYPDTVQLMRIRKAVRARVQIIAAVYDRQGGRQIGAGRIVDLSVGGAKIHAPAPVGAKDQVIFLAFKIKLDDLEEIVETSATVRAITPEDDDDGRKVTALGVQFEALEPHQRLIIMNLVYQYLLKETD